jgi:GMP synthase-like glutamine amidotransferase
MILLVDLCYEKDSLSKYEFVLPIANVLRHAAVPHEVVHYTELNIELNSDFLDWASKIILCGTALKDNAYCEQLDLFPWMRTCEKPMLGICAGMQIIGSAFGGEIVSQPNIGLEKIEIVRESPLLGKLREIEGYHLHNFGVTLPEDFKILAGTPERVDVFQHSKKSVYGIIFHPEVRNRWIIKRFANSV